jgi:hypothetical protein
MPDAAGADPFGWAIALLDGAFMGLYAQACRNARRVSRLVITFLPLMMLLVGSCKTQESGIGTIIAGIDELRSALFPDRVATREEGYRPAEGFVVRARGFVQEDPAALSQMTEQEISFMFGAPAFQRRDADARVWHPVSSTSISTTIPRTATKAASPMSTSGSRTSSCPAPRRAPRRFQRTASPPACAASPRFR